MVQPPNCTEHKDIQVAFTKSAEDPGCSGENSAGGHLLMVSANSANCVVSTRAGGGALVVTTRHNEIMAMV
jgi:hypothetical protein